MQFIRLFTILFICSFRFALSSEAIVDQKCGTESNSIYWVNYCVHEVRQSENKNVLNFFQGIRGDECSWPNSYFYDQVYTLWRNKAPIVVSISYGSSWLLAEKNDSTMGGIANFFIQ